MEAFEEKFKKTLLLEKRKPIAKEFWRAALEWVMRSDPQEETVWDMIEKELEEK